MGQKQPLPVGIDNYKELIQRGYYYADKTLLIRELIDKGDRSIFSPDPGVSEKH